MPADPVTEGFSPSVDGHVLPDHPLAIYASGRQNDVPLLAGWNGAEGATFRFWALPHGTVDEYVAAAEAIFGSDRLGEFLEHYPARTTAQDAVQAAARAAPADAGRGDDPDGTAALFGALAPLTR